MLQPVHTAPDDKIVVYLATRNLYDSLPAAYNSLLTHNPSVHAYLLIEDDTFPLVHPDNVHIVNVSGQDLFPPNGPNYSCQWSYMALMKAALPRLFPDADRLLSLDVDTIVNDDITHLWDLNLDNAYYAAATEVGMTYKRGYTYSNVGVFLMNLALFRKTGKDNEIIISLNSKKYQYPEQDAFNILCGDKFIELPADYNDNHLGFNLTGPVQNRSIISHFAGIKDWFDLDPFRKYTLQSVKYPRYVVYAGTPNYYPHMVVAAKSLLHHSPVDKIFFLIEQDHLDDLPSEITFINVKDQTIFPPDCPNFMSYYSYMTTLRAGLTKLFPTVSRILWLDPDTIVTEDISPIWNYDITDYYFAAVQETRNNDHTKVPYYNAGVMLMNLDKLRTDGMDDRIIHEINTTHYKHLEQDVLNFLCDPLILSLPSHFSGSFVTDPTRFPRIVHFLSKSKQFLPEAQQPYIKLLWNQITFAHMNEQKG